jgi:Ca2+-binding RTX toxin-like protein
MTREPTVGEDTIYGTSSAELIDGLAGHDFIYGQEGDDTLRGNDGNDYLFGALGNDLLSGDAGDDWLVGAQGNDTLDGAAHFGWGDVATYEFELAGVDVNLETGIARDGWGGIDSLVGIEGIFGSNYNDTLVGSAAGNMFYPGQGNDLMDGGSGYDAIILYGVVDLVVVNLGAGTLSGGLGNDTLSSIEIVYGSDSADRLIGSSSTWEWFQGELGHDTIEGLGGIDEVSYASSYSGVTVDLVAGTGRDGMGSTDQLSGIENVTGSPHDDVLVGGIGRNYLSGAAGDDSLAGGSGNDYLDPGSGNDTIVGGDGIDIAAYHGVRSDHVLTAATAGWSLDGTAAESGNDELIGVERIWFLDMGLALDIDGHAGMIAKILGSVFGPAGLANPDYAGWGLYYADTGMPYEDLIRLALEARLGPGAADEAVVDLLHANVMGAPPDADMRAYFVSKIRDGTFTQASLAMAAAEFLGVPEAVRYGLEYY